MAIAQAGSGRASINVTPLIDVLLVLLIIFMVIEPQAAAGLETLLPQPARTQAADESKAVVVEAVAIDSGAHVEYRLQGQAMPASEIASRLAEVYARRSDKTIFVRGDRALDLGAVVPLVNSAQAAGVEHIGIITPKAESGQ